MASGQKYMECDVDGVIRIYIALLLAMERPIINEVLSSSLLEEKFIYACTIRIIQQINRLKTFKIEHYSQWAVDLSLENLKT